MIHYENTVSESDDTYDSSHCSYSTLHGPNCGGLYRLLPMAVGDTCSRLPFAQCASHGAHEACEWGKQHDAGFYLERDFAREPRPS